RLGDDGELGRGRQRRADQRTEAKDQGGLRRKRIDTGGTFAVQQPDAQTDAAEESAQYALRQRYPRLADRTEIDSQITPVITTHEPYTPNSSRQELYPIGYFFAASLTAPGLLLVLTVTRLGYSSSFWRFQANGRRQPAGEKPLPAG